MKNEYKAVYLDVCALCRPFDDQRYLRIAIETTAVQLILLNVKSGNFFLYYSPVHYVEIRNNPDEIVSADLIVLLESLGKSIKPLINPVILEKRSRELVVTGLGVADAMHLAHAEQVNASFITCDDKVVKKYKLSSKLIWCGSPVEFCEKEGLI